MEDEKIIYFRTEKGEKVELIKHTLDIIKENPRVRIYIGSDSQSYKRKTKFVTCICFRFEENKGVHYIYTRQTVDKVKDNYLRLYQEGTRTMETLSFFDDYPIKIEALEFDYNDIKKTISTKLVSDFRGWCEALGILANFKGGEMIASKAADHICRR